MKKLISIVTVFVLFSVTGCRTMTYTIEGIVTTKEGEEKVFTFEGNYKPKIKIKNNCLYVDGRSYECDVENFRYTEFSKENKKYKP